jgi:hypothetical protein
MLHEIRCDPLVRHTNCHYHESTARHSPAPGKSVDLKYTFHTNFTTAPRSNFGGNVSRQQHFTVAHIQENTTVDSFLVLSRRTRHVLCNCGGLWNRVLHWACLLPIGGNVCKFTGLGGQINWLACAFCELATTFACRARVSVGAASHSGICRCSAKTVCLMRQQHRQLRHCHWVLSGIHRPPKLPEQRECCRLSMTFPSSAHTP